MRKVDHFCAIMLVVTIAMVLFISTAVSAQKASAEFISDIIPTKLETGQDVKDGIENLTYYNDILYVVNVWAGIQVVNVSDRSRPKEIGRYQNEHRAHNFYIEGNYGYLSDELEGVQILDISDPARITRAGKIRTKGNAFWVVAKYPYVIVAEEEKGVTIYDVTEISNPVMVGNYNTPGWAWELILDDNILYVADKSAGLQILDISNMQKPVRLGQYADAKNARAMSLDGKELYLANGAESICVIDVSNPKFPALTSKMPADGYIANLFKSGKNLFIANETKKRMDIVDVSALPKMASQGNYQADDKIYGLWKEDVYVFVAANSKTIVLRYNSPPKLAAIEDQIFNEMDLITINVEAFDPDGDALYFEVDNLPEGAAFDTTSGTLTWTPTYEQSGLYEDITIRVVEYTDSRLTDQKSFSLDIIHVNRSPVLPDVEDGLVDENAMLTINIKEGSDEDREDKGRLVYSAENLPEGATFDPVKRILTWKPTFEQSGSYVLDFVLSDQAGGVDRRSSTITVNHVDRKPVIVAVGHQTIDENKTLEFMIEGMDPDKEDQNAISFKLVGAPEGATFLKDQKKFAWLPTYDQSGEYNNLIFIMTAGNLSDSTVMSITVNHVNRSPVMNVVAEQAVDENRGLRFTVSGSDPDVEDEGKLTFTASNLPAGARFSADSLAFTWTPGFEQSGAYENITFTINDPAGLNQSQTMKITVKQVNRPPLLAQPQPPAVDENTPLVFTLQGSDPDQEDQNSLVYTGINLPAGAVLEGSEFRWTPTYDQSGEYTLEFKITDGKLNDTKAVVLTVNHVNRPPVIEPVAAQAVDENKILTVKITGSDPDTEDQGKWILSAEQLPEGAQFNSETSTLTWTPTFIQSGSYTITMKNTDPQGLVATQAVLITVNHVNRTPVFAAIPAQTIAENAPLSLTITAGEDPDTEDADKIVYKVEGLPEGAAFDPVTRVFTWTPGFEQSGSYDVAISMTDGQFTVPQTMKITVEHVNRTPVLDEISAQTVDENTTLTYKATFQDPDQEDGGKLKLAAANLPEGMTFDAATGTVSWTPTFDQSGNYEGLEVSVADPGGLSATRTFPVSVNNVNRAPSLTVPPSQVIAENSPVTFNIQATDPDKEDAGNLKFSAENLPTGATLDAVTGAVNWTPNFTQAGNYSVTFRVTDLGGMSAESAINIEVQDVNRLPQITQVADQTVDEGKALTFTLSATDEDTDNSLSFSIDNLPGGASLDAASGKFTWEPGFDQAGTYSLKAKASDGKSEAITTINVTVKNINRTPEISGGGSTTITVGETATLSYSATDPDNDALSFSSGDLPDGATLDAKSGDFRWTPTEDQTGAFEFTVRVSDGSDNAEKGGSVTVNPKPEPPAQPPQEN